MSQCVLTLLQPVFSGLPAYWAQCVCMCVCLNTKITRSQVDWAPRSQRGWDERSDSFCVSLISHTSTASMWGFVFLVVCSVTQQTLCVCVCECVLLHVWSHLAGVFLEGNTSICYKKAACDLTPGPHCSLCARRVRDTGRERREKRERNKTGRWEEQEVKALEITGQREMTAERKHPYLSQRLDSTMQLALSRVLICTDSIPQRTCLAVFLLQNHCPWSLLCLFARVSVSVVLPRVQRPDVSTRPSASKFARGAWALREVNSQSGRQMCLIQTDTNGSRFVVFVFRACVNIIQSH